MANKGLEGQDLLGMISNEALSLGTSKALTSLYAQLGPHAEKGLGKAILDYSMSMGLGNNQTQEVLDARALIKRSILKPMNDRAARVRDVKRSLEDPNWLSDPAMEKSMAKSVLDVGSLTNFANITGGQSLGYVSLDTRMARGTVRPSSFTLYQALDKSLAWQIVDFWALATATGGAAPGSAFANYSSVSSGSLATSAGSYSLLNIVLKLALDGRAITTALAAQNNYVNVSEQENTNAAMVVLQTLNWASYHGDSAIYSNQFDGITKQIVTSGFNTTNFFDFWTYSNNFASAHSWSPELTLYNLIYEASAQITNYGTFGHITHAFMSPTAMGALQSLTNTQLNNILSQITELQDRAPLVVNGNLIGMQTRFGHIQFPMDMFIDARDIPLQAGVNGATATTTGPTKPVSVTPAVITSGIGIVGSEFTGAYTPGGGGSYKYAVASADSSMVESTLTYSALVSGVAAGNAVQLTIAPPGAADAQAFRIFRSGLGGVLADSTPTPSEFRLIGTVAANGSSNVIWFDVNGGNNPTTGYSKIPGSSDIFLLDMDPMDLAIDYRMLLPLVRVELFASNLFMPWAVASIGAIRLRVPKFHGKIRNYVPTNPAWNPLAIN